MSPTDWISLAACMAQFALAVVVLLRGRGPLRFPLVLICLGLFVWDSAEWAYRVTHEPVWDWLETTSSPLHPPLVFLFTVRFVGRFRELKRITIAVVCIWFVMVFASAVSLVAPQLDAWLQRPVWWPHAFLAGLVPTVAATIALLTQHLRRVSAFEEQVTTRLLIAAVLVGNLLGATELGSDADSAFFSGVHLGNVGTLVAAVLLAIIVLRYRLVQNRRSNLLPLYGLIIGVFGVLAYLAVFSSLRTDVALLALGTVAVTLVLAVAARDLFTTVTAARERTQHLATLGRFSAQLAHDVRNPLSALKGALQFLLEEQDQGRSIDAQREFVELSMEQVERIEGLISKYRRLGAVAPDRQPLDLNDLVSSVWHSVRSARTMNGVSLQLADNLGLVSADVDLLAVALQNAILNAIDAIADGGTLTLETRPETDGQVSIVVSDDGIGMDSRQLERAFDDFFTTKADGSGLGLGFVQRVMLAHGGRVALESQLGVGTTVRLILPVDAEAG